MKKSVVLALALVAAAVVGDLAFGVSHAAPSVMQPLVGAPIVDPTVDPAGWGRGVIDAFSAGQYALAVVLLLWGLDLGLVWAGGRWPRAFAWAVGKAKPWLVGGASVLAAMATALSASSAVEWRAVLGAVALAVALYLAPPPSPPGGGEAGS